MLASALRGAALRAAAALSVALLAACGGGGGGGDGDASHSVQFSPSPLTARWLDSHVAVEPVTVTATFGSLPAGNIYPVVLMDEPHFVSEAVAVRRLSGTTFAVDLTPKAGLSAGVHTGSLTLQLCKDAQCASTYPLTGGSLPYQLTVSAALAVSIKVNDVVVSNGFGGPLTAYADDVISVDIASGVTVELNSHAEVDWVTSTHQQEGHTITVLSSSPTRWRGVIAGPVNQKGLSVVAIPKDQNQRSAQYSFFIL